MPASIADYFRYFPVSSEANAWGLAVTASGFTRIPPRTLYPPRGMNRAKKDREQGRNVAAARFEASSARQPAP